MTRPVLLLTRDAVLADEVLRLAAGAGAAVDVLADPDGAVLRWPAAPLVLVGADQAGALAALRPPRHEQVHVLVPGVADERLLRHALALGARSVGELPSGGRPLATLLADVQDGTDSPTARAVGVVAGCGGAGASTFAVALAVAAAATRRVALVDLDPWGPGLDHLLGSEDSEGVRWDALSSGGRLGSRSLRDALPVHEGVAVLTFRRGEVGTLEAGLVREVLDAVARGHDVVVLDLPRSLGGVAAECASRCDEVVLVVQASVPAVASATRIAGRLRALGVDPGLVVRSDGGTLRVADVASALELPLLTEYRSRRRVAERVDLGLGPLGGRRSPLARAVRDVLR
jgi:secretion/DNA translocation related CpaE-like protein